MPIVKPIPAESKGTPEKKMLALVRKAKRFVCFMCSNPPGRELRTAEEAIAHQIAVHSVAMIQPVARSVRQMESLSAGRKRKSRISEAER